MLSIVLALTLQATAPVQTMTAQNEKPPTPPPGAKANAAGIICWSEAVLGSRMKKRVCVREEDIAVRRSDDRDLLEKAQTMQTIIAR